MRQTTTRTTTRTTKMTATTAMTTALLLSLLLAGCPAAPATTVDARAPAAATADGLCPEHRVLEALCTKHHPSLIPVFQAKGDWCVEHGFPESICPQCHPERGGRPAATVDVADDGAPADGLKIRLRTPALAAQAGIATVVAIAGTGGPGVRAVGRVVYDASKVAVVHAGAAGIVRALLVDTGRRVKQGQALAVVESAAVGADRGALASARARLRSADAAVAREAALVEAGASPPKLLQQAEQEQVAAVAAVATTEAALSVVGHGPGDAGQYTLSAPLRGVVAQRAVAVGQTVTAEAMLFEIVDASSLWAEIDVAEGDLAVVAEGQAVEFVVDVLPARPFTGTIASIAPGLDPHTRTARARVALSNDDLTLRANMFGTARIAVGAAGSTVLVPRSAVQQTGAVLLVFVPLGEGVYETRRVTPGPQGLRPVTGSDLVELVAGVAVGEAVVTTGSFLLKTETRKDAIGAGCCE
jgi:cobalt-zinc-cadmium efflux system membrane fusion protein